MAGPAVTYKVLVVIVEGDPGLAEASDFEQIGGDDLTREEARELLDAVTKADREGQL